MLMGIFILLIIMAFGSEFKRGGHIRYLWDERQRRGIDGYFIEQLTFVMIGPIFGLFLVYAIVWMLIYL